jgi:predicted CopG family antitoxin
MATTIQLREEVKRQLARLKHGSNDTFENVINGLLAERRKNSMTLKKLKRGYIEMAEASKEINDEWSSVDPKWE